MPSNFPGALDSLTNPNGTQDTITIDHAAQHTNANDAVEAIESNVGTNSGTNVLMHHTVGQFPVRNTGGGAVGTLVQTLVGGTLQNALLGTNQITGGTHSGGVLANNTIGTPSVVGGTLNSVAIGTPLTNNYSYFLAVANYSGTMQAFADIDTTNLRGTLTLTGSSKVRVNFYGSFYRVGGTPTARFKIIRNTTTIYEAVVDSNAGADNTSQGVSMIDAPAAAIGTYAVQWLTNQGTIGLGNGAYSVAFSIEEIKAG